MVLRPERYLLLIIPWIVSVLFSAIPIISYFIAWSGSFYIFYMSMKGFIRPIPKDLKFSEQLMRPLFLPQIIFGGYMCTTSIFYFFSVLGYYNFNAPPPNYFIDLNQLGIVAQCQRYYCLGHAAFVAGILTNLKYPDKKEYYLDFKDTATFLLISAIATIPLSLMFLTVPGLRQFYFQFNSLTFIAGTLALAFAIPLKKPGNTILCLFLYVINFSQALVSGFKEPIILSVLVLGVFLYPFYKKAVLICVIPLLFALFVVLPIYNRVYRENAWINQTSSEEASDAAFDAVLNREDDPEDYSFWTFLTGRLSEMSMFSTYVQSTPAKIDFYGTQLVEQAVTVLVPRAFWPGKPIPEEMVMERVYDAGVIIRGSQVSAKPPYIVDSYLSGGAIGVFIGLFFYGLIMQSISVKAEILFGGYIIGTAFIFSGLFQTFWRGNSFEFLSNTIFWSYVSMLAIFWGLKYFNIIKRIK
jgi:hypothetical protein